MGPKNELSYAKWARPAIPFGLHSCNTDAETRYYAQATSYAPAAPVAFLDEKEAHRTARKSDL
jgi:hypothetical protein